MGRVLRSLVLLAALAPAVPALAQPMPSVVELFTSQGCASCPPADKLLAELATRPGVVALSFSVDYWDYLGWRDTLARPAHSARQKAYAEMRGDRKVFTPQSIVNGRLSVRGHDRSGLERAMAEAAVETPVAITGRVVDGALEITMPAASGRERSGEIWVLAVARKIPVVIGRGENAGRTVVYHQVVRSMAKIGDWLGKPVQMRRPLRDVVGPDSDLLVLLVQAGHAERPGPILGVASVPLP